MAVIDTVNKITVNVRVISGQTAQGTNKYLSVSLGALNKDNYVDNKALAIVTALEPCLQYTIGYVQKTVTSTLEDDE